MVVFTVLISACSSTTATESETIVVREEVQASAEGGEIAGGLPSLAQDTSVELEAPSVSQPSEESEDVTPAAETPSGTPHAERCKRNQQWPLNPNILLIAS